MDHNTSKKSSSDQRHVTIGRRNLLKAIGATGIAVVTTTTLPNEWVKPIMGVGVLPAHAQSSPIPLPPVATCISVPSPADLVLTVDVSGSFADNITTARQALLAFVAARNLSTDRIGVISFDEAVNVNLPLSQEQDAIDGAINSLSVIPQRLTSIAVGVNAAASELNTASSSGNERIIVLFSDGHTNSPTRAVDPVALQQARDAANAAKAAGIRVITVGIDIAGPSSGAAEALSVLQDMASSASDFFFVENLNQLLTALSTGGTCP